MDAKNDSGWIATRKQTTKPTGQVRDGFVVEYAPEYDKRRIPSLAKTTDTEVILCTTST